MTEVKKGREGKLGARPRAREKRGEEGVSLPPFSRAQHPILSVPFGTHATRARLSLKQWKKINNVFTRNIEILVKPFHYFNSIFVIFLSCQCSLLQCDIKALNRSP